MTSARRLRRLLLLIALGSALPIGATLAQPAATGNAQADPAAEAPAATEPAPRDPETSTTDTSAVDSNPVNSPQDYEASEQISEDRSVSFPVDI